MEYIILKYARDYWVQNNQKSISPYKQYKIVELEVPKDLINPGIIKKLLRIQNIHDLGQLLIRKLFLIAKEPHSEFYRERRFITIKPFYKIALEQYAYLQYSNANISYKHKRTTLINFIYKFGPNPKKSTFTSEL